MEIALVEHFPEHGYEVWITDTIEIGAGIGDVFDSRDEALAYATDHNVPVADLTHIQRTYMEGADLRTFLSQYLDITPHGEVVAIKRVS